MDIRFRAAAENLRLSDLARRSPQVTPALQSPIRSVHPEMQGMESIHAQSDVGLRTTDFLDLSSEDESTKGLDPGGDAPDVDLDERRASAARRRRSRKSSPTIEAFVSQCEGRREIQPGEDGYQRLDPGVNLDRNHFADTPSSSFNGSVDELLPNANDSDPPRLPRVSQIHSGRTPRSSAHIGRDSPVGRQTPTLSDKVDPILGAHAIAHEITLQALMRDDRALDRSLQSFSPMLPGDRASLLPAALRLHDPRSPRNRTFSAPQSAGSKKVQVLPPPIDTSGPRRSLPANLIRTPYPFTPSSVNVSTPGAIESVLTVRVRRSNAQGIPKVSTLTLPAANDFGAMRADSIGEKERHFRAIDFDDEEFFKQLRSCYRRLSGPMHFFSARSLTRIMVSGPVTKAADAGYGWLHQPRSSRAPAYKGLNNTFSEEKVLQHYRKPRLGRSRYAFVQWAHRLAAAPPVRTPQADENVEETVNQDLLREMDQPEGLEFVLSWSALRISLVLGMIMCISIAAALLWVFLGRNTVVGPAPEGGYHDAGDRVGSGVLLGICTLLVGLSGMAGWLGISWLMM